MFHVPEELRIRNHPRPQMNSDKSYGNNGAFCVRLSVSTLAWVIASDGDGWEHISVHITDSKIVKGNKGDSRERTPTWGEMCKMKDLFWDEEDCVIQFHPPKSEYVNNHNFTLHLWKPVGKTIETPNSILVGIRDFKLFKPITP